MATDSVFSFFFSLIGTKKTVFSFLVWSLPESHNKVKFSLDEILKYWSLRKLELHLRGNNYF